MTIPLAERVPDLGPAVLPESTGAVTWRRATTDDAEGLLALHASAGHIDHPDFEIPLEDIRDELGYSWIDLDKDSIIAEADSQIVAFGLADLTPGQDTMRRVSIGGTVHPQWRRQGLGTAMLEWQRRRAAELLRAQDTDLPGRCAAWSWPNQDDFVRIAETSGMSTARWFLDLHRDLNQPIDELPLPGYAVVNLSAEHHEGVRLARNDAFRDHWGSQPTPPERWRQFMASPMLRPDLSFLALDDTGEVAGFVLTEHNPADTELAGYSSAYIALVGVVRAHRKRGVAPALLAATLRASAAAGLERAVLEVDVDSPTGAVGLYTGLGFTEHQRSRALTEDF